MFRVSLLFIIPKSPTLHHHSALPACRPPPTTSSSPRRRHHSFLPLPLSLAGDQYTTTRPYTHTHTFSSAAFLPLLPSPRHPQPKASDALPLYLTNTIFFTLFFSVAYYLLNRWRDKIRTSTPLYLLTFSEISAIVILIASFIYLLGFFGINFVQSFISRASHDAWEEEEHQRRQQQHLSQHRQILPPTPLSEPLASSDDEEYVGWKWKRFHSCRSGWESFKAVRLSGGNGGVGKTMPWGRATAGRAR